MWEVAVKRALGKLRTAEGIWDLFAGAGATALEALQHSRVSERDILIWG